MLDELAVKIARNDPLSLEEIKRLRQVLDLFVGMNNGASIINVKKIQARQAEFDLLPTHFLAVGELATQSIPNFAWTQVTLFQTSFTYGDSSNGHDANEYFRWDKDTQRFYLLKKGRRYVFAVHINWADNDAGGRAVTIDSFLSDGTYNSSFWMDARPAWWTSTSSSVRFPHYFIDDPDDDAYFELSVFQDSGAALNIDNCLWYMGVIE